MSVPATRIDPEAISSNRLRSRSKDVFPEPDGPTSADTRPLGKSVLTPFNTGAPARRERTSRRENAGRGVVAMSRRCCAAGREDRRFKPGFGVGERVGEAGCNRARRFATAKALEHRMRVHQVGEGQSHASAGPALVELEFGFALRVGRVGMLSTSSRWAAQTTRSSRARRGHLSWPCSRANERAAISAAVTKGLGGIGRERRSARPSIGRRARS